MPLILNHKFLFYFVIRHVYQMSPHRFISFLEGYVLFLPDFFTTLIDYI